MKILSISTMFPNKGQPSFGIFVLQRLLALNQFCETKVICPIPYFPLAGYFKKYAYRSKIPPKDQIAGLEIYYPRFLSIPMILKPLDSIFLFISLLFFCRKLQKDFNFNLIDSHLAYPDGFAAVLLGKVLKKPVTVTVRGHDIFSLPSYPVRGKQVLCALKKADHIFSVAQALKDGAVKLGIADEKITVTPNGIDRRKFPSIPQKQAREALNLPLNARIIISVGHLVVRKGFQHIIKAFSQLPEEIQANTSVIIIGEPGIEGDYSPELKKLILDLNLTDKVKLVGAKPHEELYLWYNAADIFCLASEHEGYPNVVVEAMACGLPVVASNVWGIPELITNRAYGILVNRVDKFELTEALQKALAVQWNKENIMARVAGQNWENVAEKIYLLDKTLISD
ncbi:MAG: glycosyltransferase family 4 protein [Candidatus Schekmanbacteria bacterium]|nr:glycosyltransferase family 4 protein [Candidatus Schekmanbacteria bacterium]